MKKGSKHTTESIERITENNARRGKTFNFSIEHRQNLSIANKGQISWIKGKHQSSEHILNRVQSRIKNGGYSNQPSGENHYLWISDRSKVVGVQDRNNPEYKQWRKSVLNRDGWKCRISDQNCSGKLIAHHILSWSQFPELHYKINNGITLCHAHHPRKRAEEKRLASEFQRLVSVSKV